MNAVDLFAGLGGWAEGARIAAVRVLWAANHARPAVDAYKLNHPETHPECQDLQQADFYAVPDHDVGLCSPACQGHSAGRGVDQPRHDVSRATAWACIAYAEAKRPYGVVVENVPRFLKWVLYPAWEMALERLGYRVSVHLLDAADHGVPQNRVRVFIVCTRSKEPFRLAAVRRPHVSAESILDPEGAFRSVRTLCHKSRRRIAAGRRQHGDRFVVSYYSSGSGLGGRSLARPLPTVTTKDRFALVEGNKSRMLSVEEYRRAMSFPASYKLPANKALAKHLLGNAVCPVQAADILADLKSRL